MWQGWADNGIPPSGTVDYYDILTARMGGPRATKQFARLFMFPTVYHCRGGYGGVSSTDLDMTLQLVQWVENGVAPTQVNVTYPNQGVSRPVYPYPLIPHYNGSGDPNDAASFHPVASPGAHYTDWIGNYLFYAPVGRARGFSRRG
jgi:feruloyl esterase